MVRDGGKDVPLSPGLLSLADPPLGHQVGIIANRPSAVLRHGLSIQQIFIDPLSAWPRLVHQPHPDWAANVRPFSQIFCG